MSLIISLHIMFSPTNNLASDLDFPPSLLCFQLRNPGLIPGVHIMEVGSGGGGGDYRHRAAVSGPIQEQGE